jgi:hypothetical protein
MSHPCELENLGGQVLKNSGNIDGSLGANAHLVLCVCLQETLDTAAGELEAMGSQRPVYRNVTLNTFRSDVKPVVEVDAAHAIRRKVMLTRELVPIPAGEWP